MNCIYCDWLKEDKNIISKSGTAVAFLANISYSKGHSLVCPIKHYESIFDIPDHVKVELYLLTSQIAEQIDKNFEPTAIKFVQNERIWDMHREDELDRIDGEPIYHIPHVHLQIIPLYNVIDFSIRRKLDDNAVSDLIKILRDGNG